jgi:hypothetical protein
MGPSTCTHKSLLPCVNLEEQGRGVNSSVILTYGELI